MKLFLSSIISVIIQFRLIYAEPVPVDQMPRLPEIGANVAKEAFDRNALVNHLKATFSQIKSFAFSEQRTQENEAYWALCWKEIEDKYYYEVISGDKIDIITAFDGRRRSVLLGRGGTIDTKNGDFPDRRPTNFPSPLDLFSFLNVNGKYLSIDELRSDSSVWDNLAARITYAGTKKFMGRDCIVLRFLGTFNYPMEQYADYDVFFDASTLMPLGWRAYDRQRFMIEQLEALDFKTITGKANPSSFTYPSHCRITEYQWHGTLTVSNRVIKYDKGVRDEHYDEVEINSLSPEDVQIDPSLAAAIFDEDSKVITRLPK